MADIMDKLIVVDKNDKVLGYKTWEECHGLNSILHRAFSIFIFNNNAGFLLQKRSQYKPLWPLFWSNTCCSHPRKGEKILNAAQRRLKEEFGFKCKLRQLFKFSYKAIYKDEGSENETCTVLLGKYNGGKIRPDKNEISEYCWISLAELKKKIKKRPETFTPWFKKIIFNKKLAEIVR